MIPLTHPDRIVRSVQKWRCEQFRIDEVHCEMEKGQEKGGWRSGQSQVTKRLVINVNGVYLQNTGELLKDSRQGGGRMRCAFQKHHSDDKEDGIRG